MKREDFNSSSEWLVYDRLTSMGFRVEYEENFGGKHPDLSVYDSGDKLRAVIEVEDLASYPVPEGPPNGFAQAIPTVDAVREKINCSQKQLKHVHQGIPRMLVLGSSGSMHMPDAHEILDAMWGKSGMTLSVYDDGSTRFTPSRDRSGRMRPGSGDRVQNTSFSAIARLTTVNRDSVVSGLEREIHERGPHYKTNWDTYIREQQELLAELDVKYGARGLDFESHEGRLMIVKNPDAKVAWPDDLVGDLDDLWEWDAESLKQVQNGLGQHGAWDSITHEEWLRRQDERISANTEAGSLG
jgi:hypothetical protein